MAPFPRACLWKAGAVGRFLAIEVSPDNHRNPLDMTNPDSAIHIIST